MPSAKTYAWKDPKPLTMVIIVLMAFDISWVLSELLMTLIWGGRVNVRVAAPGAMTTLQIVRMVHSLLAFVVLAGLIVRVFWILRVSRNAHVLRGRPLANSPLFAALWWYLIPFMSLFKPLEAMGEIWDVSAIDAQRRKRHHVALIGWWIAVIASGVLTYASFFSHQYLPIVIVEYFASTIGYGLFAYIAWRVCDMQVEKRTVGAFSDVEAPLSVLQRLNG